MSKKIIGIAIVIIGIATAVVLHPETKQYPIKLIDKISRQTNISIFGINAYPPKALKEQKIVPPFPSTQYTQYREDSRGLQRSEMNIDGVMRSYYSYTPKPLKGNTASPAIILLHGSNRTGVSLADKWRKTADRHGIKVFSPDSAQRAFWSYELDRPFIHGLLQMIKKDPSIDPYRIYLFGHSAGGSKGALFAADFSKYLAAGAFHAGRISNPEDNKIIKTANRKIPVCFLTGTLDKAISLNKSKATAKAFADAGHSATVIGIVGHNHWYYTLADWINEKAWNCMTRTSHSL